MYNVEYDMNDYNYENLNQNSLRNSLGNFKINKKLIFWIIFVILIISAYFVYRRNVLYYDSYEYLEYQMVENAKKYVKDNNLKSNKQFYIEARKLNVSLKSECQSISGVFVNGNEYKAYLICSDYETEIINNNNDYITLNGKDVAFLNKGMEYVESSYETDEDVVVNINGVVGTEEGVYELEYVVTKYKVMVARLIRKIVVIDNPLVNSFYPTISLLGDNIQYLSLRDNYVDKGAFGKDKTDGALNNVKVIGKVNTLVDGEYNLRYVVVNSKGYAASVSRKVIVAKDKEALVAGVITKPSMLTNDNVKIIMSIFGNNYAYTILPNGEQINKNSFEYEVSENGSYEFKIYDQIGNYKVEKVEIANISRIPPKGTCNALVYSNYADISVSANSNIGISSYNYVVNNRESGYISSFNYRFTMSNIKNVKVSVKDIIGNVGTLDCQVKYMDPTIGNTNILYYKAFGNEYVIPKTKSNLDQFVKKVKGKISQNANVAECGDACLSFSCYHAQFLQYGNMNSMNLDDACHYRYQIRFDTIYNENKQEILKHVYNEIFAGRVAVLQVGNGNGGRHFVLVVGYRRNVYSADALTEDDLIYIDSWGGTFNSMANPRSREMFYDKSNGGYRVDKIKSKYYSFGS